jgi:lysophospholipase L1-like esterase
MSVFSASVSIIKLKPGVTYHVLVMALLDSGENRRSKEMSFAATEHGEAIHLDALFPDDGAEAGSGRLDSDEDKTIDSAVVNEDLVICFGDSLTYGTGAVPGMDYPSQLGEMIDKQVLNKGVPGDTTISARRRLTRDVLSQNPGWVLITLGGNDLKNGVSKKVAFYNLDVIVTAIQDKGAKVIIGGLSFPNKDRGFGSGYEEVAAQTGATLIPNVLSGIIDNASLMTDPIHPNGKGYRLIAERFKKALLRQ